MALEGRARDQPHPIILNIIPCSCYTIHLYIPLMTRRGLADIELQVTILGKGLMADSLWDGFLIATNVFPLTDLAGTLVCYS